MCETLAREYSSCYGIPTLVVRLFSMFGPKQRRLLVWELFWQFQTASEVIIEGTGEESRDYLAADDLAAALAKLLPVVQSGHTVLNVGSGISVTVRELAERVKKILHSPKRIRYQGLERPGNPRNWQADISLYRSLTGDVESPDLDLKLTKTIHEWQSSAR